MLIWIAISAQSVQIWPALFWTSQIIGCGATSRLLSAFYCKFLRCNALLCVCLRCDRANSHWIDGDYHDDYHDNDDDRDDERALPICGPFCGLLSSLMSTCRGSEAPSCFAWLALKMDASKKRPASSPRRKLAATSNLDRETTKIDRCKRASWRHRRRDRQASEPASEQAVC